MDSTPQVLPLILFLATYLAIAPGRLPGLAIDRTGFALLGSVLFVALGFVSLEEAKNAIDAPTMALLFGMMVLSAQYHRSGLYDWIGDALARVENPRALLLGTIFSSATLATILTNDVVCFALAPLLLTSLRRAGLPPLPYLLALAAATNIGSALTPIGNPQNILIAQRMHLEFLPFVKACLVPVLLSLVALHLLLRHRVPRRSVAADLSVPNRIHTRAAGDTGTERGPLDRLQAAKAIGLTLAVVLLFISPFPAALAALGVAGVVLTSRKMRTDSVLSLVDWQLLALFAGLFVVNRGLELSGWTEWLKSSLVAQGIDLGDYAVLVPVVALLGVLLGNVPATMLLLPIVPSQAEIGTAMALISTMIGNLVLFASIANLIVAEQAARHGERLGFLDHLKVGLPITLLSVLFSLAAMRFWG